MAAVMPSRWLRYGRPMAEIRGYAGVTVRCGDQVLLIRAHDYYEPERVVWGLPSGSIEPGEAPAAAAARELAEESGCVVTADQLTLVWTTSVRQDGRELSRSWNYAVEVPDMTLGPLDDPDGDVIEAVWCTVPEALEHLATMTHAPMREPALRHLRTEEVDLAWEFEVVSAPVGGAAQFTWHAPLPAGEGQVRAAEAADLDVVLGLYRHLHPTDPELDETVATTTFHQILTTPGMTILLLELAGEPVATTYLNVVPNLTRGGAPYAVIENVVVAEQHRGRGLGKAIMAATLSAAWQAGCYKAMLMTGSRRESTHAFYRSCGLTADEKTGYVAHPPRAGRS